MNVLVVQLCVVEEGLLFLLSLWLLQIDNYIPPSLTLLPDDIIASE